MWITVFGASQPDKRGYNEARELGELIAKSGHYLKNGGYGGTMEASAKGCAQYGGVSHGVCVEGHPFPGEHRPNVFLNNVIFTKNIEERIKELLKTDTVVVLPGSIGTLHELMVGWVQEYCKEEQTIPIHVVGEKNRKLIDYLSDNEFIRPSQISCLNMADLIYDLPFLKI